MLFLHLFAKLILKSSWEVSAFSLSEASAQPEALLDRAGWSSRWFQGSNFQMRISWGYHDTLIFPHSWTYHEWRLLMGRCSICVNMLIIVDFVLSSYTLHVERNRCLVFFPRRSVLRSWKKVILRSQRHEAISVNVNLGFLNQSLFSLLG